MGRGLKEGLDYANIDCDIFTDPKVSNISLFHGIDGEAVLIRLILMIARNGYYIKWDADAPLALLVQLRSNHKNVGELRKLIEDVVTELLFPPFPGEEYPNTYRKANRRIRPQH